MTKPKEIILLEKHLNTTINYYDKNNDIIDLRNKNTFSVDSNFNVNGLNLRGNKINDISFLENFTQITSLSLQANNEITNYEYIENLYLLKHLNLAENGITDISFIKNLTFLTELILDRNSLENIDILENLTDLEYLKLWQNKISDIKVLKHLKNLRHLNLWDNKINDITPIKDLINLTNLDLDSNLIINISSLKQLTNLSTLYLDSNHIQDITPLRFLKKLKLLDISYNKILDFSIFEEIDSLNHLTIAGNNINDISFLKNLKKLNKLDISFNQITDLSSIKDLTSITHLNLSENKILDIANLKFLKKLIYLNLDNNFISNINPILELIKNGIEINNSRYENGLRINENPLEYPPIKTFNDGNDAIIRFFKKIEEEGTDSIYEAKITLVGEGSAGKTSLLNRLLDPKSELPQEKNRTRGISIKDWEFKKQPSKKHVAHIWDFGGQDVYYPVHRFFLTEDSVFVLLASSRQNTHHFDYWIPTIYQFGGKSPIILGQTCHEGNITPWNDIGAYIANENFNIIKDQQKNYHEINLPQKNKGLAEIKNSIINQIQILPHYKKNVPKSWIAIRQLINNSKKENCISYLDLKSRIMKSNPESFPKKEDVDDCIKFFHSIGVLLWYNKEHQLKNWVILNPKWSVDAVYRIIDDQKILKQKGIILTSDFERVWNKTIYEDKHEILKDMLEVFKIAFPKKHSKSDYIMPTRLQSIPPENIWNDSESYLRIEYRYEFMPKGMINQISAELSRYIIDDDQVWNNGVNFCEGETTCQVFEDFYNRKITVKARGNDARSIIMIVMNAVKDISDGYKGVNPKIIIPCNCEECLTKDEKSPFSYEMLLNKIKKNKDAIVTCNASDEVFKIDNLLFKIGLPNPLKEVREEIEKTKLMEKEKNTPTKIFVTYSWSDENEQFDQEHQNKVGKFVNQLRTEWNLDASFDLHKEENNFMKMMYENLSNNNKIIIVLSKGYAVKANSFKGGVGTEYERIINDIKERPQKYILVSFDKRNNSMYPFGFQGNDLIEINSDLVIENLPDPQNRLLAKLTDESLIEIPALGGKTPKVTKKVF